ncbi:DUF4129 domain-containing protein [Nocardia macrotermitis]|uniref:Protein-glutamine gamma-glutamyltransferase-like C-terminal domain-containing protein n=1 Tax=Nocardia macrotermitis TaxID=2585198 RepID=A0A7K0D960_9NOCA|nr:DUF4129 domain-containing protein [Nocardia macrotermitis]MQY22310.1 hypothetical protein [Nocardia macrotermitis]
MSRGDLPPAPPPESVPGQTVPGAAPPPPHLGPAGAHRSAAEQAAQHSDFSTALRERFRAVVRGLEQGGVLEVQRSRTARETADNAAATDQAVELPDAARNFDEVVYGGRPATEAEYRLLEQADRYSLAPPPPDEPVEQPTRERQPRQWRVPPLPELLRNPKFWAVVVGILLLALIVYVLLHLSGAPQAPPTPTPPQHNPFPSEPPPTPSMPDAGEGQDSIFERLPHWLAYGGLQWLICAALVVWWRARRRGALVGEPRPVQVAANELLAGQAALYRRSADRDHTAAKLRAATMRRIRPILGLTADAPPDRVIAAVSTRTRTDPNLLGAVLFGPVADDATLEMIAAQLDRIESEIA